MSNKLAVILLLAKTAVVADTIELTETQFEKINNLRFQSETNEEDDLLRSKRFSPRLEYSTIIRMQDLYQKCGQPCQRRPKFVSMKSIFEILELDGTSRTSKKTIDIGQCVGNCMAHQVQYSSTIQNTCTASQYKPLNIQLKSNSKQHTFMAKGIVINRCTCVPVHFC